ncbi:MAG: sister chromatid cohesion protein 1 [Alectoria fallacina]|uniref:Sister chromatid cohesion protein 1 n=1 Tax=Alectoria fallacina TaxID=1903189 RepID=A0A8H3F5R8_9LECA|nr:MAG: sister chromatid cohesion protein 1 [Alectoria fallacina]
MFYSETLLSKTGPLARVWLSANLERKLSKTHILQSNIESSVNAIVDQGTAPMALRLSGQLLLGVVRIYSRKARYLLDDCNEALLKIKMAFRPGNVDLPANLNMPSAAALTVADRISDPMMPDLDPSLLDFRPMNIDFGSKKDDPLNWNSQVLSDPLSIEIGRHEPRRDEMAEFDEEDMNIDLDLDLGLDDGPSIEVGRKAPLPRSLEDDLMGDEDKFQHDFGYDENTRTRLSSRVASLIEDRDDEMLENGGMLLDDADDFILPVDDAPPGPAVPADPRLQRASQSPLSSVRSSVVRDFDATNIDEEGEEASMHQATHKAKKRKIIQTDSETMLSSTQIKQQQVDRSAILKPASYLSRDPMLLNLMSMQKNGDFVSSIMREGRAKGWAPELRGILSIEVVRKSGELKRKRDSGFADVGEDETQARVGNMPQLEIPEDDTFGAADEGFGLGGDAAAREQSATVELPVDDGLLPAHDEGGAGMTGRDDDEEGCEAARDQFDDTTVPLLHPIEQGAVSQGTKHAVHLLRDRFESSADGSLSQQKKANILFQQLLPEVTTSKADATKMFFEVLVLATKDAVKVEQAENILSGPLRIRAKRGLWGAWAETEAGGEIAEQETAAPTIATIS